MMSPFDVAIVCENSVDFTFLKDSLIFFDL